MTVHNERSGRKSTWNLRCNIPNDRYCLNSLAAGGSCCMKTHNSDPTLHCSGIWISCQAAAGNSGPFALVPDGPHVPDCRRRSPNTNARTSHRELCRRRYSSLSADLFFCFGFPVRSGNIHSIRIRYIYLSTVESDFFSSS